jgi:DNA-binding protein HU-beta
MNGSLSYCLSNAKALDWLDLLTGGFPYLSRFVVITRWKQYKGGKMTKSDLIYAIAEKAGLSKADASKALSATLESVTDALKAGEKVALIGFGTFSVSLRAARTGKNPQTGEALAIPASKAAKFKAGQKLKDAVN